MFPITKLIKMIYVLLLIARKGRANNFLSTFYISLANNKLTTAKHNQYKTFWKLCIRSHQGLNVMTLLLYVPHILFCWCTSICYWQNLLFCMNTFIGFSYEQNRRENDINNMICINCNIGQQKASLNFFLILALNNMKIFISTSLDKIITKHYVEALKCHK